MTTMRPFCHVIFLVYALMRLLSAVTSELTDPSSVQVGDEICFEGFVMDKFCIDRGTLLDNPNVVTLEGPDQHSVHCLVDVDVCRESTYYLLADPMAVGELYTGAFQVDDAGKQRLVDIARGVGICGTCTGNGDLQKGFRAQVRGTVTGLGNGSVPPTISITDAVSSNSLATVCDGSVAPSMTGGTDDGDTSGAAEQDDSDADDGDTSGAAEQGDSDADDGDTNGATEQGDGEANDGDTNSLADQGDSAEENDTTIKVVGAISTVCIVAVALLSIYGNIKKDNTIRRDMVSLPLNFKLSTIEESTYSKEFARNSEEGSKSNGVP